MSEAISYMALLNALPEAAIILDSEQSILAVNDALLHLLQKKADEVFAKPLLEVFPEAFAFFLNLKNKIPSQDEGLLLGRFFELKLSILPSVDGLASNHLLLLYDTSIRKQTEAALIAQEQRYRTLFEHSNDAIFILDIELNILLANEQAASLLQVEPASLPHQNILDYLHRGEKKLFGDYVQRLLKGDAIPAFYDGTLVDKNTKNVSVEMSLSLVRDNDKQALHIQIIARDIREQRFAQEMMRARLEQFVILRAVDEEINRSLDINHVLRVSLDAALRLSQADAGFIALTAEDKLNVTHVAGLYPESVIGAPLSYKIGVVGRVLEYHEAELVLDVDSDSQYYKDIPETQALMAFPLISQERLLGILNLETIDRLRFDESIFEFIQLLASRISVAVENARLYEFVRKQLNELSALYDELRAAEKLKTDMMRIANHDLKNPLSIVRGYVDLMAIESEGLSAQFQEYILTMRQSLERADQILHDFLSAEAISARARGDTFRRFDLRDLVVRALQEFTNQAESKGLKISANLVAEGLAMVKGDAAQLYEAITNLISNAIKYTAEGGAIVLELSYNDYNDLAFFVRDTGYGIPKDRQARLFEPFYRPTTAETSTVEGSGLGLHLVKNIIERHHGQMYFESVYQEGSSFGFSLPISMPE